MQDKRFSIIDYKKRMKNDIVCGKLYKLCMAKLLLLHSCCLKILRVVVGFYTIFVFVFGFWSFAIRIRLPLDERICLQWTLHTVPLSLTLFHTLSLALALQTLCLSLSHTHLKCWTDLIVIAYFVRINKWHGISGFIANIKMLTKIVA